METLDDFKKYYALQKWDYDDTHVIVNGEYKTKQRHPYFLHSIIYNTSKIPEVKFKHLKAMHFLAFPHLIPSWNAWAERRFYTHCEDWEFVGHMSGGHTAKSFDMAFIAWHFYNSDPANNAVIVTSTSLKGIDKRVWGYIKKAYDECKVQHGLMLLGGNSPQVLYKRTDTIHGIFPVAAKQGSEANTIKDIIGHHPNKKLLLVLDECTDMPIAIYNGIPNLRKTPDFQVHAVGNPKDEFDLHGILCKPEVGYENIDYTKTFKWRTTQQKGVCLYYHPYESPYIIEQDPEKKKHLKFLPTPEKIQEDKDQYGENSPSYFRFCLGQYPRVVAHTNYIISKELIQQANAQELAHFAGVEPLMYVAGLDPAFSDGGDNCQLQIGAIGVDIEGRYVIDFRSDKLRYNLPLQSKINVPIETQVALRTIEILKRYNIPIHRLAIDCNGQGRAIGEVIRLNLNTLSNPIKIMAGNKKYDNTVTYIPTLDMWADFASFLRTKQVYGLDGAVIAQLTNRLILPSKTSKSQKKLESKPEYRSRMGAISAIFAKSPDEADACILTLQAAIRSAGFTLNKVFIPNKVDNYNDVFNREKPLDASQKSYTFLNSSYRNNVIRPVKRSLH